ncbi:MULTISPECIES: phage minor head protein [Bacillus cereus group]|uniref:phage minor head protein n=1 Tax=Bacillus cereus group TaxID=86661 RepID=UPI001E5A98F9|nr:phage minor head protein [Bacillus paranthracis]MCC2413935.1 phage head morphogenesis protein [Bacillus paranthracis]MDK7492456.1 phage minor head protein [Bacillus paranthracis]
MESINRALHVLNTILKAADTDGNISDDLPDDMPGADSLQGFFEEYEKKLAKLLRKQMKYYCKALSAYGAEDIVSEEILNLFEEDLFINDTFENDMANLSNEVLLPIIIALCEIIMESLDPDILFEELSEQTEASVTEWGVTLAAFLFLATRNGILGAISVAITGNLTVSALITALQDLQVFSRGRASSVAKNEVLTALSIAQQESYGQSPAVTGKMWVHTDRQEGNPRGNHQRMDGLEMPVDEEFEIEDSDETCMFPREPKLSPAERMHCHCIIFPVIDGLTIVLSKEDKEALRQQYIAERRLKK